MQLIFHWTNTYKNVLDLSQCPVSQIYRWPPWSALCAKLHYIAACCRFFVFFLLFFLRVVCLTFLMRCKREKILRNFDCSFEFVFSLLLLQPFNFSPVSFACNFQDWGCVILREIDFLLKICRSIPCLHPSWKVHTCRKRCCDRKSRAACAQSFAPWQQATIEITRRDHSIIAYSRHIDIFLFFAHIPFVVNHTINATPPERLQQRVNS